MHDLVDWRLWLGFRASPKMTSPSERNRLMQPDGRAFPDIAVQLHFAKGDPGESVDKAQSQPHALANFTLRGDPTGASR